MKKNDGASSFFARNFERVSTIFQTNDENYRVPCLACPVSSLGFPSSLPRRALDLPCWRPPAIPWAPWCGGCPVSSFGCPSSIPWRALGLPCWRPPAVPRAPWCGGCRFLRWTQRHFWLPHGGLQFTVGWLCPWSAAQALAFFDSARPPLPWSARCNLLHSVLCYLLSAPD